jgi:hypothetical protein
MKALFKKFLSKEFLLTAVVTYFLFEGIESLLHSLFDIDLHHLLSFGGSFGFIVLYGFKFHILCCIIPTVIATVSCLREGKHKCTDCHDQHPKD